MSKLFKILISLTVICLSCVAFFACNPSNPTPPVSSPESIVQSTPESEPESEVESEVENESNFEVELPEVDRM